MTIIRLRVPMLLAMLVLTPALDCGSVTTDPGGTGSAGGGPAGSTGGATAGSTGTGGGGSGAAGTGQAGTAGGGHDGGAAGGGGQGGSGASCSDLQNQYAAAFTEAQTCTVGASQQCTQLVSPALSVCGGGCMTYVDDATTLNAIKAAWQAGGCNDIVGVPCPAYACLQPRGGTCVASDGGGATCKALTGIITSGAQPAN